MNTGCLFYPDLTFFSVFKKKCETQTQVRIKKKKICLVWFINIFSRVILISNIKIRFVFIKKNIDGGPERQKTSHGKFNTTG